MSPEEFERLKEEEKKHLRELRALKGQYRDVQRKKSVLDALQGMARPDLDATHDEAVGKVMGDAAYAEARLDLAMESRTPEPTPEEREALRKAEAAALVQQMKAAMGEAPGGSGASAAAPNPQEAAPAAGKTLGRAATPDAPAPGGAPDERGVKTLGRPPAPSGSSG